MAKYVFPAIITPDGSHYSILFPDIESCYSCGVDLFDALKMAEDVLSLRLCDDENEGMLIPSPSDARCITHTPDEIVTLIPCDTTEYRRKIGNCAVE